MLKDANSPDLPNLFGSSRPRQVFLYDVTELELKAAGLKTNGVLVMGFYSPQSNPVSVIEAIKKHASPRAELVTRNQVILIGASTGGPEAITKLLSGIAPVVNVPVIITVHMPEDFIPRFVDRLSEQTGLNVKIATDGANAYTANVWFAPGGRHLEVRASEVGCTFVISDGPPVHSCKPAVDVLFNSASQYKHLSGVAILLTGIGADGASGCLNLKKAGWKVWIQDEASSVVWGMPGAAFQIGGYSKVMNIEAIIESIKSDCFTRARKKAL